MQKSLFPLAKAIATASVLSAGLSACVAGNGGTSSSADSSMALSSQAQSSQMSSVAPSSSSVMSSSSSSIAPSSSSVMSSSSVAAANCSNVDTSVGQNIYLNDTSGGLTCTTCHGEFSSAKAIFDGAVRKIDPNNFLESLARSDLEAYIAGNMAAGKDKACADAACEIRSKELAKYMLSKSNDANWCDSFTEASSSAPMSSSSVASSSSSVASQDFEVLYAVNAGGNAVTTQGGIKFDGDFYVKGGNAGGPSNLGYAPWSDGSMVPNQDLDLFRTERWGEFTYNFPLKAGSYNVTIYMLEGYNMITGPGQRVFDVLAEGQIVADNVDIYALAGARDIAYSISVKDIQVDDGNLTLDFAKVTEQPSIRAIVVEGAPGSKEEYVPDPGTIGSAAAPSDCPSGDPVDEGDFVMFDGGSLPPITSTPPTVQLHGNWVLQEVWAGDISTVNTPVGGSAIQYLNRAMYQGFKFASPNPFKFSRLDIWVQNTGGAVQDLFGIRAIRENEFEGEGGAPTTVWMRRLENVSQNRFGFGTKCTLVSSILPPESQWPGDSTNGNTGFVPGFTGEAVKFIWENMRSNDSLQIRRIVLRDFEIR